MPKLKAMVKKAKKAVENAIAWGYSRWKDYEKCPAYFKFKYIRKLREPDSPQMARGTIMHQLAAHYVRGVFKKEFPKELGNFQEHFDVLKQNKADVEQEWAFNKEWEETTWFGKDCWLRIKVDACEVTQEAGKKGLRKTTVRVVDYKSGKNKPEHAEQRDLYGLGAFLKFPDASIVIVEHWYIDQDEIERDTFKAADVETMKEQWEQRTRALLVDDSFVPRPGSYCGWCAYRKGAGGPCPF